MEAYAPVQRLTVDPETLHPAKRTLVLNGALPGDETLEPVEEELFALLRDARTEIRGYSMREIPLAHCQGCFECWTTSPGMCKTEGDAGREIAAAMIKSDLMVILTPITFGGYSSEIKKALDRSICMVSPWTLTRTAMRAPSSSRSSNRCSPSGISPQRAPIQFLNT